MSAVISDNMAALLIAIVGAVVTIMAWKRTRSSRLRPLRTLHVETPRSQWIFEVLEAHDNGTCGCGRGPRPPAPIDDPDALRAWLDEP